uniref:Uncharacterized protein n=1 Tax=Arundo donax TaxID=35708 RepID=A0A0A9BEP6_ARUDO
MYQYNMRKQEAITSLHFLSKDANEIKPILWSKKQNKT